MAALTIVDRMSPLSSHAQDDYTRNRECSSNVRYIACRSIVRKARCVPNPIATQWPGESWWALGHSIRS